MTDWRTIWMVGALVVWTVGLGTGCERMTMREQAAVEPLEPDDFFEYRQSARPLPKEVVARGHGPDQITSPDPADYSSGRAPDPPATEVPGGPGPYPMPVDAQLLDHGRDEYETNCSPCHGLDGYGNGTVVQRGFPAPPSYHIPRLRQASPQYIVDVIENGFGRMYSYAARVRPRQRWAIAAYIEALQLSQNAPVERLDAQDRRQLGGAP